MFSWKRFPPLLRRKTLLLTMSVKSATEKGKQTQHPHHHHQKIRVKASQRAGRKHVYVRRGAGPSPTPWRSGRWHHRTPAAWRALAQVLPAPHRNWGSRAERAPRLPGSESAEQLLRRGGSWRPAGGQRHPCYHMGANLPMKQTPGLACRNPSEPGSGPIKSCRVQALLSTHADVLRSQVN